MCFVVDPDIEWHGHWLGNQASLQVATVLSPVWHLHSFAAASIDTNIALKSNCTCALPTTLFHSFPDHKSSQYHKFARVITVMICQLPRITENRPLQGCSYLRTYKEVSNLDNKKQLLFITSPVKQGLPSYKKFQTPCPFSTDLIPALCTDFRASFKKRDFCLTKIVQPFQENCQVYPVQGHGGIPE